MMLSLPGKFWQQRAESRFIITQLFCERQLAKELFKILKTDSRIVDRQGVKCFFAETQKNRPYRQIVLALPFRRQMTDYHFVIHETKALPVKGKGEFVYQLSLYLVNTIRLSEGVITLDRTDDAIIFSTTERTLEASQPEPETKEAIEANQLMKKLIKAGRRYLKTEKMGKPVLFL